MTITAQAIKAREARLITQTITRPFTTITTIVTLGDGPTLLTPTPTPPPPPPTPTPTTSTLTPAPSSSTLNPQELGALLGCILGLAFLAIFICLCVSFRHKPRLRTRERVEAYYYDNGSESDVVQVEVLQSSPQWAQYNAEHSAEGGWTTVPPPAHFPPTPRRTGYWHTWDAQIPGVARYP